MEKRTRHRPGLSFMCIGTLITIVGSFLVTPHAPAQPLNDLVFTIGTTIQDGAGNNWSYVLLGAPSPQLLAGKRFAIYGKSGFPTNSGSFTLRGTIFQQTDPAQINNLLNQSVVLNENLASLSDSLNVLLHNVGGIGGLSLPQKVLQAFQLANSNPTMAQAVLLLSRNHPGLTLCAGSAFSEQVSSITTYELREVNLATGLAGDVLGRVTVIPGAPVVLPAPGLVFQVTTNAPSDHLRIRLRWGTPDTLRRLSLLQYGFNVWRISSSAALAAGYNTTPPTPAALRNDPNFTLANSAPVMATRDYSAIPGPDAPTDVTDRTTHFFADDIGRALGGGPSLDGTNFYYFVTARDILGRDGLASAGSLATACRRLPPNPPTNPRVLNAVKVQSFGTGLTNIPYLNITWLQNSNLNDVVSEYWVYRWQNPTVALTSDSTPLANRIAVVPQVPGTNLNSYADMGLAAPPGASNYWYTIRSVSHAACGDLLSSHTPPAWAVLRERTAPAVTTGEVVGSCGTPVTSFQYFNFPLNPNGVDTNNLHYRFTCQRRDRGIAWVQFVATRLDGTAEQIGPLYFAPDSDTISADYSMLVTTDFLASVSCTSGTYYGLTSPADTGFAATAPASNQIREALFLTGELLFTALHSNDTLLQAFNLQSTCYSAVNVTPDASGTIRMQFTGGFGLPMLIQFATPNPTNPLAPPIWTDLGAVAPDANNFYSIYYAPCLVGPLPPFQGCTLNLLSDGNCSQHVISAGDSGDIAPLRVKFRLMPRTREFRLYRQVDGGPSTLVAQGPAVFDRGNPGKEIDRADDAMPPSAAHLCYFVQLLDENGNGSPLSWIGCKDVKPPKPPLPVLSEPLPAGTITNPQVALQWFCPTAGVYRFEIKIERADQPGKGAPTGLLSPLLRRLSTYNSQARYRGLFTERSLLAHFDEAQLTPPIGANFGPGPQFSLTASVLPNVPYHISVAAQDDQGHSGDPSQVQTFLWKPPTTETTVPWPARPLPAVQNFDEDTNTLASTQGVTRVAAVLQVDPSGHVDFHYPIGIRIGDITPLAGFVSNINSTNSFSYNINSAPAADPNNFIFQRLSPDPSRRGQPLLPVVVYRQQVPNTNFPHVSGSLTQVTPLLERLAYTRISFNARSFVAVVQDPLIAAGTEVLTPPGGISFLGHSYMYLRDQQPIVYGASYQYFVVRLNDRREISEVIPAGTVTIPPLQ